MCGRFELKAKFENLPEILKQDYPCNFDKNYEKQSLIRPTDPVIVLKDEGKVKTTFMSWGLISSWTKNPLKSSSPRPFNARSETVAEKKLFKGSWRNKRCLIPSTGFFEKGFLIRKKNYETFWLGGIWSRWNSPDGSEFDSCCILTTESNNLVKNLHNRMPVVVPNRVEKEWLEPVKEVEGLKKLVPILKGWSSEDWIAERIKNKHTNQMNLF